MSCLNTGKMMKGVSLWNPNSRGAMMFLWDNDCTIQYSRLKIFSLSSSFLIALFITALSPVVLSRTI
ncbi:hypothetical protein MT325_m544L [Paramecium bursaria chlorella virus MT325]|uniref:Uncharacterized protein m544L n=1 Tax=Paramecium bursaria Chlorella virus MT325 TaxID=346932 RepID=A7IUS4_PBCVM|nr:hypothetical protein MT325_m544L [Paramecium bursaria chlorella virus MT325]